MTGRELVQWMGSCIRERWSDLKLLVRIMFGRAWISTVALCVLFLLFFKNDQAQDILRGMIDPCKYLVLQQQPNLGPCQQSLHQYWWFFLATLLLAIPLGMVAYFGAVPSWRTDSPREGTQEMRERRVGQFWALIVLVASLAIPHFEFWIGGCATDEITTGEFWEFWGQHTYLRQFRNALRNATLHPADKTGFAENTRVKAY